MHEDAVRSVAQAVTHNAMPLIKMADSEMERYTRYGSFYKSDPFETAVECGNCLELNKKCIRALEEIGSLNLTIKLLMDELKLTNLDKDKPPTNDIRDNSDDVVVPDNMNDGWIEVSSGHYASSSGSIKGVHLLAPDSILTSNRYEPLVNLSDTHEREDNTTLPGIQVTVNNMIINELSQIPTIINGVIHSSESEKSPKYGSVRTRKTQPLKSRTSRVLILSDSHLRGSTTKINNDLGNSFRTNGWIKPGAPAVDILNIPNSEVVNKKKLYTWALLGVLL